MTWTPETEPSSAWSGESGAPVSPPVDLMPNGGFEYASPAWEILDPQSYISSAPGDVHSGAKALVLRSVFNGPNPLNASARMESFLVVPGETYSVSAWVNGAFAVENPPSRTFRLQLAYVEIPGGPYTPIRVHDLTAPEAPAYTKVEFGEFIGPPSGIISFYATGVSINSGGISSPSWLVDQIEVLGPVVGAEATPWSEDGVVASPWAGESAPATAWPEEIHPPAAWSGEGAPATPWEADAPLSAGPPDAEGLNATPWSPESPPSASWSDDVVPPTLWSES